MNPPTEQELSDRAFIASLKKSQEGVDAVATWLRSLGLSVKVPPIAIRPEYKDRKAFVDNGDLYVGVNGHQRRAEVKWVNTEWTCVENYPYERFLVVAKKQFDAADPKPFRYFILNKSKTYVISVNVEDTYRVWWVESHEDHREDRGNSMIEYYFCPFDLVKFIQLPPG